MYCDLWHKPSGNMIGYFDSEAAAVAELRGLLDDGEAIETFWLTIQPEGADPVVVEGRALIED
jgi:hypothetical protein